MQTSTHAKRTYGMPTSVEDHDDFIAAGFVPGDRFRLTMATHIVEDAEFVGLWTEHSVGIGKLGVIGMQFRIDGDGTVPFRWAEIDNLQSLG